MMVPYVLVVLSSLILAEACYWNAECPYQLYSSKTPYDTIRGDIRDIPVPQNCEAISIWSLHRHGNRNPGNSVTEGIKIINDLKDEIISSFEAGRSQLCAQDIDEFRKFTWNSTLEVSQSFLTGTGYEEIYDIAKRIKQKYPHLLNATPDKFYFRPTNEQRTITSAMAFVHALTEGTSLDLPIDGPWERDDIIRPYQNCARYQEQVRGGPELPQQIEDYMQSPEFLAVRNAVQQRLGIYTQLSGEDVYNFYEICRFYRSWTATKQSPWCSAFSDQDLIVLEYRDDVRHFYRNGYGSWINGNLGGIPLKDLYENFEAAVRGEGKNIVSYFTHDTMMQMTFCAMGLFKDESPLQGSRRDTNRLWRSSYNAALSTNIITVLNRCTESGAQTHRVQIFVSEKETHLCPHEGCTWQQFQEMFQNYTETTLDFCDLSFREPEGNSAVSAQSAVGLILIQILMLLR